MNSFKYQRSSTSDCKDIRDEKTREFLSIKSLFNEYNILQDKFAQLITDLHISQIELNAFFWICCSLQFAILDLEGLLNILILSTISTIMVSVLKVRVCAYFFNKDSKVDGSPSKVVENFANFFIKNIAKNQSTI